LIRVRGEAAARRPAGHVRRQRARVKARLEDAHDDRRLAIQGNASADDVGVGTKLALPEHIAEHNDAWRARSVFLECEDPSPNGAGPNIGKNDADTFAADSRLGSPLTAAPTDLPSE
jgi:hypothetical protein